MRDFTAVTLGMLSMARKFTHAVAMVGVFFIFFTTFVVVVDVSARYLFGMPIPGVTESLGLLVAWIIYPALGWALLTAQHVRVTLVTQFLPVKGQAILDCLVSLVGVLSLGIMAYFAVLFFWDSFIIREFMMSRINVPLWLGKMAVPIGLVLFFLLFVLRLLVNLASLTGLAHVRTEDLEAREAITK